MDSEEVIILGVKINDLSKKELLEKITGFLKSNTFNLIFTPNPEICLKAKNSNEYRDILNDADLRIPDGFGLKIGAEILEQTLTNRITGVDLTKEILTLIEKQGSNQPIFIINNKRGLSSLELIKQSIHDQWPNIKVSGIEADASEIDKIFNAINKTNPNIIFCTLGAPDQEEVLIKLKKMSLHGPTLGLAIGGTFDFITGKQKRAPQWWRAIGMEWFYRLLKQPQRIGRIADATLKFPLACEQWKRRMETQIRQNVLGVVKNNDKYLVQRNPRFGDDHWQFPQGGVDHNEKPEQAVLREISEETGININSLTIIKKFPVTHYYDYPRWHQLLNGYKGQEQQMFLVDYQGNPSAVTGSYEAAEIKWIDKDELTTYIHSKRQESLVKILPFLK